MGFEQVELSQVMRITTLVVAVGMFFLLLTFPVYWTHYRIARLALYATAVVYTILCAITFFLDSWRSGWVFIGVVVAKLIYLAILETRRKRMLAELAKSGVK